MIRGVAPWIHGLAEEWGKELRRFEKQITSIQGTMGRIRDEGPFGALVRANKGYVPNVDFRDQEVRRFHMAWGDLDVQERNGVLIHFKEFGSVKEKIEKMETNRKKYYEILRRGLDTIERDFHLYG